VTYSLEESKMEKDMTIKQIDRWVEQEAAKAKTLADCKRRLASLHREEVLMRTYGIFGKYPNRKLTTSS
jgi:hypothetical protein